MEIIDRTITPPFRQIRKIHLPKAEWKQLNNQVPVVLLRSGTQPVVRIEFIYKAGKWFEKAPGVSTATGSMLIEGTHGNDSRQISEALDSMGSYLNPFIEADRAGIVLYCLSRNFNKSLELVTDLLENSVFPDDELEIYLRKSKERLLVNREQVSFLGQEGFLKALFGSGHPYGRPVRHEDYDNIDRQMLINHHKHFFQETNPLILVSGNWNFDLLKELDQKFGSNNSKEVLLNESLEYPSSPNPESPVIIPKKGALQSALFIVKRTMNRYHPDYNELQILAVLLGGYFGSRLMKNIREEKGFTYGISARLVSLEHAGYFVVSSEVNSKVCQPAIQEVYKEIKRLRDEPVEKEELDLVKNYLMGNWLSMFDGPFNQADSFRILLDYGLDESYFSQSVKTLQETTPERLRELAGKYLQEESFITVVAGKY